MPGTTQNINIATNKTIRKKKLETLRSPNQ